MKEIKLKGLEESIYTYTCDNGLEIYMWVNPKANSFKGTLMVNAGSEDVSFTISKRHYLVPFGTPHYLEHYLCKNKDGTPLLGKFNAYGSYSNAATFPRRTLYEFMGTGHFEECLNLLLDSILKTSFLIKNFEAERGPILEEARMQKDNHFRTALFGIHNCLFSSYPNRVTGLGTISDIHHICMSDLETYYKAFYHPKNMKLVVTGNIDPLEVIRIVRENLKNKTFLDWDTPQLEKYREPRKVVVPFQEIFANVESPKVYISFKIPKKNLGDEMIALMLMNLVLMANFDVTSSFVEDLLTQKLIYSIGAWAVRERDYFVLQVSAKTKYVEEVTPILMERLLHLEMNEKEIQRKIKGEITNLVLSYEDPEMVNDRICQLLNEYGRILPNEKEILENITLSDIKNLFDKISMKEKNIFILRPQVEKEKNE